MNGALENVNNATIFKMRIGKCIHLKWRELYINYFNRISQRDVRIIRSPEKILSGISSGFTT